MGKKEHNRIKFELKVKRAKTVTYLRKIRYAYDLLVIKLGCAIAKHRLLGKPLAIVIVMIH